MTRTISSLIPVHRTWSSLTICWETKMKKKLDCGLREKDITEMLKWFTSHTTYSSKVKHLAQSVWMPMVLFQSPRDKMKIKTLSNQLQAPQLIHAFNDATSKPHGYLLIDLKPNTPSYLRLRTDIFQNWFTKSDHQGPVVYKKGVPGSKLTILKLPSSWWHNNAILPICFVLRTICAGKEMYTNDKLYWMQGWLKW